MTHNAGLEMHLQNKACLQDVLLPCFLVWFRLREEMPPVQRCESLVPPGSEAWDLPGLCPLVSHSDFPCPSGVPAVAPWSPAPPVSSLGRGPVSL